MTSWKLGAVLWFCFIGLSIAEVTLRGAWRENEGWEVTCGWNTWMNDSLQSVRMFRNGYQYFIFRPETHGEQFHQEFQSPGFYITVECKLGNPVGQRGVCVNKVNIYEFATEDTYTCEVSGERPMFKQERKDYTVFVPPSDAMIKVKQKDASYSGYQKMLNCTSSGLPPPKLVWTINGNRIEADFSGTYWNNMTKLWNSWSTLNLQDDNAVPVCTPEVATRSGMVERGKPIEYRRSDAPKHGPAIIILAFTVILSLRR